ncbi:competence/damage-inducible protein A [Gelria sp. Kuro-4]|uniref:competence/damage-inducible protein A n=1 Tax=Gelria sp. Kuro-4 TaxID=2796927 RepID=UPI001BEEB1AE|nr:competence/damage-inducible protein A [Gelria sp. Kuro-4]MDI3522015.1 nicotinamide-nucleotide amidase [Bacillota bacterium]BCV25006.1 putative competence-damage inducible protein [Gelria sp. Kuro-4]
MEAEIISVGTELLLGQIVNTDAQYLGERLAALGIDLHRITTVGDNAPRLQAALAAAWGRADLILLTGGLGPTQDDLTKETAAAFLGLELILDEGALEHIRCFFARTGRTMPPANVKQALIPAGGQVLPNPNGTAPGVWVEKNGHIVVIMPGPPFELKPMFESAVVPKLRARLSGGERRVIKSRVLKLYGIGESHAEELVRDLIAKQENPTLAPYAKETEIQFRLTAKAGSEEEADALLAGLEKEVEERLGPYIFARDNETMQEVVGRLLKAREATLAVAESCTGGLVADWLTNVPGSSEYFLGGVVSYSNAAKEKVLGVPPALLAQQGAVSAEVAEAMAKGVRALLGADYGAAVTGLAGPGGGTPEKPVGLVFVAAADAGRVVSERYEWRGGRLVIKRRAAQAALNLLRRLVAGLEQ